MKNILCAILSVISMNAYSYTECTATISKIFLGNDGAVYIFFDAGGSALIAPSDINLKNALSAALAAFMANRQIVVRYKSNGALCTKELNDDFSGLWILKN